MISSPSGMVAGGSITSVKKPREAWQSQPIGQILVDSGYMSLDALDSALAKQKGTAARLGDILKTFGFVSEETLLKALTLQYGAKVVDISATPPDPALMRETSVETCLRYGFLPWRRTGNLTVYVTSDPVIFHRHIALGPRSQSRIVMALASASSITAYLTTHYSSHLSHRANTRCPAEFSCRSWARPVGLPAIAIVCLVIALIVWALPILAISTIYGWVFITLLANSGLRLSTLITQVKARYKTSEQPQPATNITSIAPLPVVSLLVPLHKEAAILPDLVKRLAASNYPKELLDVMFILESNDALTKSALAGLSLPQWIRLIEVPPNKLQTKPRAMNYALDFCKGSVVGIYDAEDAPEADQIHRIVDCFNLSGPDVACVQGYLDFYNPAENWLARCFTIEYAIWFRVVLHGIEKLGLPIPLGGTTVFFRREALEKLGAWDAHNVTEDADLGFRLARQGYRCAFLATTTFEEANCHLKPWIKQRSRWLKGYAATWITHMRRPLGLLVDLGPVRFFAFQVMLLGTISNFLVAPMLWLLWLSVFGLELPLEQALPKLAWLALGTLFALSELILLVIGVFAVSGKSHRHLIPWVPAMIFYWPLGSIAMFKAAYELVRRPFYWDKTQHGQHLKPAKSTLR